MSELIYQRLADIMAKVPAIAKDQKNVQQGYAFRGIDDMYNALHGLFADAEVVVLPEVLDAEYVQQPMGRNQNLATDVRLRIRYRFVTTDGSSTSMTLQGESRDYADKATNQAMSGAFKYGLLQMFLIPLSDTVEADHQSPVIEPEDPQVVAAKKELVKITGSKAEAKAFWEKHHGLETAAMLDLANQEYGG